MEPIDPTVHVLVAADIDKDRGSGLAAGDHGRVSSRRTSWMSPAPVTNVIASHETERELGGVKAHSAIECLVVLNIEFQFQAGEIGSWQMLQPQVVVVSKAFHQPRTAKSSAAWKIPEMETPVSVASWSVVVAARPAKPCNWRLRRGSNMWSGSTDKVRDPERPQERSVGVFRLSLAFRSFAAESCSAVA